MNELLKLLQSKNEEDNILGLELIRARHPGNWGAFTDEVMTICKGETEIRTGRVKKGGYSLGEYINYPLVNKYFYMYTTTLKVYWDEKIS